MTAGKPLIERYVTSGEAADVLGLSPHSLGRYARDGRIPSLRTPGGHYRFQIEAVRQALKGGVVTVEQRLADALALLDEIAGAGVAFEDPRVKYVEVQIDTVTWNEIKEYRRGE